MKLWKKMVLTVYAVFGLGCVLLLALRMLKVDAIGAFLQCMDNGMSNSLAALTMALILVILTVFTMLVLLIVHGGRRSKNAKMFVLESTADGRILIREQTLVTMITQAMGEVEGVSDVVVHTDYDGETIAIGIDISVSPSINIPATTLAMQKRVRQQVVEISGIAVKDISLTIVALKMPEDLSTVSVADVVSASAVKPEEIAQPEDEPADESETEAETQAETEAEIEPETESEPEPIPEIEVESEPEAEPETEAAEDPEPEATSAESEDTDTEAEPETLPFTAPAEPKKADGIGEIDWSFDDFIDEDAEKAKEKETEDQPKNE